MPNAIITGATRGMGKAIAEKLLAEGFSIAFCARNEQQIKAAEAEWNEKYPTASIIAAAVDVSVKEDVHAFADTVLSNFAQIDMVVNNVGTFAPGTLAEEPDGLLEKMLGINLFGAYRLTRRVLPAMMAAGSGHIFNICSVASLRANPGAGAYGISKYALMGFNENLREELRPHHIKVTAICPGSTYTSSWEDSDVDANRLIAAADIANSLWSAYQLTPQANIETLVIKPLKELS